MTSSTVSSESAARQERGDPCGIDHHPAIVSSKHVERQEQGDPCSSDFSEVQLLSKPTKNPKPNMYSQANVRAGKVLRPPIRALPSVIVDTENVSREADGPVGR